MYRKILEKNFTDASACHLQNVCGCVCVFVFGLSWSDDENRVSSFLMIAMCFVILPHQKYPRLVNHSLMASLAQNCRKPTRVSSKSQRQRPRRIEIQDINVPHKREYIVTKENERGNNKKKTNLKTKDK